MIEDVWEYLEREGIIVEEYPLNRFKAVFYQEGDRKIILVKKDLTYIDFHLCLWHEYAHYYSGALYPIDAPDYYVRFCENKAHKTMLELLMPLSEIETLLNKGYREIWEFAGYFSLPETLVRERLSLSDAANVLRIGLNRHM